MQLTRIVGFCPDGRDCPTVYATDRGTLVIQGDAVDAETLAEMGLPDGETATEIPIALLEAFNRVHR